MILVTGATGTIGNEVVRLLAGRGASVRAMTRNPSRVVGVEAVWGDFDSPDSLRDAVAGAKTVFLLTAPGAWVPDHDLAMIHAALDAGVRKVVKLSAIGTEPGGWHHPGEQALRDGDLAWTLLRPSSFASNALQWAETIKGGGPVPNRFGTGAQGVVDPRDVAAVAVEALLTDKHDGQTYTLTGPEPLSVPDQVAQLADVLGHAIETVEIPPDVARRQMLAAGLDSSVVEVAMRGAELVRAGGNVTITDDVASVLGRAAGTFRSWAHDHRDAFTR